MLDKLPQEFFLPFSEAKPPSETSLHRLSESIRPFLSMADSTIAILDLDYLCIDWLLNKKSEFKWTKYDRNKPLTLAEMVHKDDIPRLLRDIAHFKRFDLKEYESMYRLSDMEGQYFWDLTRTLPIKYDKSGRITHAVAFIRHLNHAIANSDFVEQVISTHRKSTAKMLDRKLTSREKEVLKLIGGAMTDAEIAGSLFISKKTVVSHRRNLLKKLNARNKLELVKIVSENGLLND